MIDGRLIVDLRDESLGCTTVLVVEATICHIIKGRRLLLKRAARGVSKGKWNAPGGRIETGETPRTNATREVLEETQLKLIHLLSHGTILYFMGGKKKLHTRVHLFSSRDFVGSPRSTLEGEVKWFAIEKLPFDEMWDDDRYWINAMLVGSRFDAKFYFDAKNIRVTKYEIISR